MARLPAVKLIGRLLQIAAAILIFAAVARQSNIGCLVWDEFADQGHCYTPSGFAGWAVALAAIGLFFWGRKLVESSTNEPGRRPDRSRPPTRGPTAP